MSSAVPIQFMDLKDQFARTRQQLSKARHLPGELYTSKEVEALEKEKIFLKTWLCAGRADEIPNAGDYMTREITGEPFVLTRDASGAIVAFMNMCLHRGVAVAYGSGNANDFSCPYHAWLYDLGGNLVAAPRMNNPDVDLKNCRLKRLQSRIWRGWIFISFNPEPMPFDEFIGPIEKELWWFKTEECRFAEKMVIEVNCNWKLLVENLVDVYHVPVLHKGTIGAFNNYSNFDVKLLPTGGWAYDQKSRPHSSTGQQMFPTLPWLEAMSGDTSSRAGIFPNLNLSMRYDSLRMWQVWPKGVDKTELHIYLIFPPAAFEMPDFQEKMIPYKAFVTRIVEEDISMVQSLQHAMSSPFYQPGPMANTEAAVHHIMKQYLDAMQE
jgi:choline monooxygenase